MAEKAGEPLVRKTPYPYRSMLAVCSDLDETPDRHVYFETLRFLNTNQETPMGPGLSLETGNTIYFNMPPDQFSYWNTDDLGRHIILNLMNSGHIDCLHSYGDLAASRADAEKAVNEMSRRNCRLEVWIDHSVAPTNFGPDIMRGQGDIPGSRAYHADITCGFGIRFVWLGRVTSVIGQDSARSLKGIWNMANIPASFKTVLKELLKGTLAVFGKDKYAMHGPNRVIRETRLRDGRPVYEFLRCNPHYKGVSSGETADGIAEVLAPKFLNRLVQTEGICILYTHLGKVSNRAVPISHASAGAFRRLAEYYARGKILVATTRRILNYCLMKKDLRLSQTLKDGCTAIDIENPHPNSLDGLTLYCDLPKKTRITVNGREAGGLRLNPPDHTGRPSISFPWKRLEFPVI